jgi:hypothetical protein
MYSLDTRGKGLNMRYDVLTVTFRHHHNEMDSLSSIHTPPSPQQHLKKGVQFLIMLRNGVSEDGVTNTETNRR